MATQAPRIQPPPIPTTPRVISPSPTASESSDTGYFTRSAAKRVSTSTTAASAIPEAEDDVDSETEARARARSRSPGLRRRRASGNITTQKRGTAVRKSEPIVPPVQHNGYLSPRSAGAFGAAGATASYYWRELSRSPSPLGLIPIHRHWRRFVHRHEVPRKLLHVSIGFVTLYLYAAGWAARDIHPWLLAALVPIAGVDVLRHRIPAVNRFYVRALGALMRESEFDRYNGVIFYLGGVWFSLAVFPKDVAAMSVLLLSWCDTAASTFGRLYGRYTPRVRRSKSLAGSIAATLVGVATAWLFWGFFVPRYWDFEKDFMFRDRLRLPTMAKQTLGLTRRGQGEVSGSLALTILSVWTGLAASASELVDLWGLDDNLTIPVLSGIGLWGFLKLFE